PRPAGFQKKPPSPSALACALGALTIGALPLSAHACATCGCSLSTDAATGYSSQSGWRVNLEYDYIDQDQLRGGGSVASPSQVVNQPSDPSLDGGEIEKRTTNRYLNLSVSYRPNADWGFSLLVPEVQRDHTTYGVQTQPFTPTEVAPNQISSSHVSSLGDVRLVASYQGFLPTHNLGVQVGVKLPTGNYGGQTDDGLIVGTPVLFKSGPWLGQSLDTSLQAGNGSTDLIVGAYYYQPISQNFDAFVNGQFEASVAQRMNAPGANFRPGNQVTMSTGLRYEAHPSWVPQLQLNLVHKSADQGAFADAPDTAGNVAYLSPGVTVSVRKNLQVYTFAQLPVYSHLAGYQLFPRWTASVGVSAGF
ncbi:MAG TPA: transporter, partial [Xanthomonadaceae bacterium]|nr:transporter [Xanthomonadaceae bacterium]